MKFDNGESPIRSRYARLIILTPPEPPKILQGPVFQAVEDSEVSLECISVGGKPAAEITWVDNDGGVLTQGVMYTAEPLVDGRRFTARSVLRFRPRKHHHNQTFTCQAQNTADRAYRSVTITLKVQYAPKVRVFFKTAEVKGRVQEGDTLVIGCQAHANPKNLTYKWFVNNEQVFGSTNELILPNISRKYNEATIKCEVQNIIGKSADTKTIEVIYGPTFKQRPRNIEVEVGTIATLTCNVDGHPAPKILWLRYENDRVIRVGKSGNLTISVTPQSAGQYWCRATIENRQDIEAPATVFVRGPPKILSNETQFGVEGDSVRIECISFSVPKPDLVMWTFGGSEINAFHNQDHSNAGSETDLHPTLHLYHPTLACLLAGPVPIPEGYENELMNQYQRYSGDFQSSIQQFDHLKAHGQSNGYVPYVDYSKDYVPPGDSLTGSLTRSTDGSSYPSHCGSLHRQASCGRLGGVGPDVIPSANPGVVFAGGLDVRYAATYGNPYLRGSGPVPTSSSSPSSSSSSRPVTSPLASSSSPSSGAQPQVPKSSPATSGALYKLPPSSQRNIQTTQITSKGTSRNATAGTHV
ncbi:hypothetical protein ACJJTC_011388 [Scirpophaga incertulas]